jgi:hypothetical protein
MAADRAPPYVDLLYYTTPRAMSYAVLCQPAIVSPPSTPNGICIYSTSY